MEMIKCVSWIFTKWKGCTSLSSSSCYPARLALTLAQSVSHTQSLLPPLTLCMWSVVPFTLIKHSLPPNPFAHTPSPEAWITKPLLLLIGVISSSEQSSFLTLPPLSQLSMRSPLERPKPSPLTDERSSSTTMLLQRGKQEDKWNIVIFSASSSISIVIAISQITLPSIHFLPS